MDGLNRPIKGQVLRADLKKNKSKTLIYVTLNTKAWVAVTGWREAGPANHDLKATRVAVSVSEVGHRRSRDITTH